MLRRTEKRVWRSGVCLAAFLALLMSEASAQTVEEPTRVGDTIVVTATRTERSLGDITQAVTVIERDEVAREARRSNNNLINVIARLAPGVSPPQGDGTSEDFTIRGRPVLLLIDGVPQNSNDGFSAEFSAIDPAAIERIEVLRGASAIYGEGANGGVINIITRTPSADGLSGQVSATLRVQPEASDGDGLGGRGSLSLSGRSGRFSGLFALSGDVDQGAFDANGDRIPAPIGNDNREINLLTKIGVDIDENQSLTAFYNGFFNDFESAFISDPAANLAPLGATASALEVGDIDFDDPPSQTVHNASLQYTHKDFFGTAINAQFFYRNTDLAQTPSDISTAPFLVFFPFAPSVFQTTFDAEEIGGRLVFETPVTDTFTVTYGADVSFDDQQGVNNVIDPDLFATASQAAVIGGVTVIPPFSQRNIAGFGLAEWQVTEQLRLNAGVRYETIRVEVDPFTASPFDAFTPPGAPPVPVPEVTGGDVSTDDVVFNAGLVYDFTSDLAFTFNFSQGFALPPFLGSTVLAFPISNGLGDVDGDSLPIEAERVTNYEGGVRLNKERFTLALNGFYNASEEGSTLVFNPVTGFLEQIDAPQRNFGLEFDSEFRPIDRLRFGTSVTWVDGNFDDPSDDLGFVALTTVETPPFQIRAFVEDETLPGWTNRIDVLTVGDRTRGFEAGNDPLPIEGYTLVDLSTRYAFGSIEVGLAVQNLFDNDFIPVGSQTESINATRFNGLGRVLSFNVTKSF